MKGSISSHATGRRNNGLLSRQMDLPHRWRQQRENAAFRLKLHDSQRPAQRSRGWVLVDGNRSGRARTTASPVLRESFMEDHNTTDVLRIAR